MLRVGHDRVEIEGSLVTLDYNKVQYDKYGFACCKDYRPLEYDLCVLKTSSGLMVIGWWTGFEYYSSRLRNMSYIVVGWKKLDA